jgi:large subunit ribosomal protein L4
MPRKMRQAALRSALSAKAAEEGIVVVDALTVSEPKTRVMVKSLNSLVGENSALVLIPTKDTYESVIRSTKNIPDAKILLASYLNIRDLMVFDKVVLPLASLDLISQHLG